jgi:undecaprenyl-diphosphatase
MTWWQGAVLGLVQGLAEFLPVSSKGHLVLAKAVLGVSTPGVLVEVLLHVATLVAVLIVYRRELAGLIVGVVRREGPALRLAGLLILSAVPAGIVGVLFHHKIEESFHSLWITGIDFAVTGLILWSTRWVNPHDTPLELTTARTVAMGLAQALAILPGISRSGSTITAGLWGGLEPVRAAEFSFLMAVPVIAGAAMLETPHLREAAAAVGTGPLIVSFLTALVSGILAIRLLLALLRRRTFYQFAPYCWAVAAFTLLWAVLHP